MYRTIILAYDGSHEGQRALLDSQDIVQWSKAMLWLVAVRPATSSYIGMEAGVYLPELETIQVDKFKQVLADGLRRLEAAGCQARSELLVGESVDCICGFATKVSADLIVVGHQHRSSWAERWWKGSVSGALIEYAPCSVLCVISP